MGKTLNRNSELVWRDEPERKVEIMAELEAGKDAGDEGWVIIVDGGEINQLNLLGGEIWLLCDGTRDQNGVVEELLKHYEVPRELLEVDVGGFIKECLDRGWLILVEA
jgi:pyrroloquinoline quinone biosynthesis protein D